MPKGFQNFGNTCCFNSVMQCLLQTVLLSFGLNLNLYDLGNVLTDFTLSEVFMELASKYNYPEQRNGALKTLYYKFIEATQSFNDRRQHNSLDLLINFLDILRVEERNARKLPSVGPQTQKMLTAVDQIFGGQFITVYTCHSCQEPYAIRKPFLSVLLCSLIPDEQKADESKIKPATPSAFEAHRGITVRRDTSNKQIASRRFGTFFTESQQRSLTVGGKYVDSLTSCETDLSSLSAIDEGGKASSFKLAIKNMLQPIAFEESAKPEAKNRLFRVFKTPNQNVSQCLKYLTRAEVIDSRHLCRNCHLQESDELRMTSATKRTLISSPPAILVLHLERFEQKPTGFAKRNEMISYDELLDLGPFCSCSALRVDPEDENVWYSLYAVVVNCDFSISKGHYVAYVKQRDSSAQMEDQLREKFQQKNFGDREKVPNDDDLAAMEKRKAIKKREKAKRPHPIPGPWYYIRDDSVRSCDAKEALEQKALLLFYERIPGTNQKTIGV